MSDIDAIISDLSELTEVDSVKSMLKVIKLASELKAKMPLLRKKLLKEIDERPFVLEERTIDGLKNALLKKYEDVAEYWNLRFEKGSKNGVEFLSVKQENSVVDNIIDIWWTDEMIPYNDRKRYEIFVEECTGDYFLEKPPKDVENKCETCGREFEEEDN